MTEIIIIFLNAFKVLILMKIIAMYKVIWWLENVIPV